MVSGAVSISLTSSAASLVRHLSSRARWRLASASAGPCAIKGLTRCLWSTSAMLRRKRAYSTRRCRFASLHALPVIFVCENNGYSTHSPLSVRQPDRPISRLGLAHNVPGVDLDGNDVVAVRDATVEAVDRARTGGGPTLLVCETYRWLEHVGPNSDTHLGYRSEEEVNSWMLRDPLITLRSRLLERQPDWEALEGTFDTEIAMEVEEAFAFARSSVFPDPSETVRLGLCRRAR